jgi:hypothetical protein
MAFQSDIPVADFLRRAARGGVFAESAPASNFLLEERLPLPREGRFLAAPPGPPPAGWDSPWWLQTFGNHFNVNIALPARRALEVTTFAGENGDNHLPLESHQDVVRLESLRGLHNVYPGDFASLAELASELRALVESRQPGKSGSFSDDRRSRLALWLDELNLRRDARPAFAAPFGEVEPLLANADWPTHLRNVLGLSHLWGTPSQPLLVILCRYNLSRVERAARKAKTAAWAAVPTVLEAGSQRGPGTAFFPFPKAAGAVNPFGFGVTVSLSPTNGLDYKSELLHFRLDYKLDDFAMVGEVTDEVNDDQLQAARQRHFDFLESEFAHRADVP